MSIPQSTPLPPSTKAIPPPNRPNTCCPTLKPLVTKCGLGTAVHGFRDGLGTGAFLARLVRNLSRKRLKQTSCSQTSGQTRVRIYLFVASRNRVAKNGNKRYVSSSMHHLPSPHPPSLSSTSSNIFGTKLRNSRSERGRSLSFWLSLYTDKSIHPFFNRISASK